ncbi:glycoside hydrolase family 3 C-terminal domain-containing protein [Streptomyces chryseus]|uniref:Glycosyl hydrolase n=1 Tax=Streptomyces chryseus TaxID=68186 RepID=A0ABQ3DKM0_9ACTN|nr:glycoside hydrolase family 3 C-terminal domain-containing protein [Streptomyces chryseus]GHB01904.1 glycosyl hydrolase [Streptomyces chryseus]
MTEEELDRLLGKLSLGEKVRMLTGATTCRTHAEPAAGLAPMVLSDGPAGVRGEAWDERDTSALLPCASALGALWDEGLVERLGGLLAAEARRKGVDVVLAPTLNLHRSPLGGRHFECFSEDPELTGRTGAALIRGIQAHGIAATAKHYVANEAETERLTVDVRVGERALREVYLAPFAAAVAAGVRLVMAGYNGVNGATMTENALLTEPLKGEWGFDGVVVSDWGAVRGTTASALSGLDLVMPGPGGAWGDALVTAVDAGLVPVETVDDKVRRLLRLAGRVGALGGPAAPPASPPGPGDVRRLLRRTVAASAVLLRNDGVLPLDPGTAGTVAVIGAPATRPRTQGGGSAGVFPQGVTTPLDGIREALAGRARVVHAPGPAVERLPPPLGTDGCRDPRGGLPGVLVRTLDARGRELYAGQGLSGRQLEPPTPPGARTVEISAVLTPDAGGAWTFGVGGFGRMSLTVDDRVLVDGVFPRATDDPAAVHVSPPCQYGGLRLEAGRAVRVVARRELAPGTGRATLLAGGPPAPDPAAAIREAADAARAADTAVVFVATARDGESEGQDRTGLGLPGAQDALVRAVTRANARTVVVVNAGGPVEMPWRDAAAAVLLAWFPGQEAGAGIADVLCGAAEPGGRLPTTWGAALDDVPVTGTRPEGGALDYAEGLHIGHRAWLRAGRRPAYWFGHGLGWTTWAYEAAAVDGPAPDGSFTVRARVRNTGPRRGREVVQVYLAKPDSAVERPHRWFAGYAAVDTGPGEAATAHITVAARALRHWSVADGGWRVEPGAYQVLVGPSAGELPLSATLDTAEPPVARP